MISHLDIKTIYCMSSHNVLMRVQGSSCTHRLAVAPLPGAVSWVPPVQANPEVPIIAATTTTE